MNDPLIKSYLPGTDPRIALVDRSGKAELIRSYLPGTDPRIASLETMVANYQTRVAQLEAALDKALKT